MDEETINELFQEAAVHTAQKAEDVRLVFSILVGGSLRYRDHVLRSTGRVVTVEHVRTALKWLVPVMATGETPEANDDISLGLLKTWVEELSSLGYPKVHIE
jgi:hypothetical protein